MDEKVPNHQTDGHPTDSHIEAASGELKHEDVDVAHNSAIKGDDSDGKLDWTFRSFVAYISLCFVYTGKSSPYLQPEPCGLITLPGSQMPLYFAAGSLAYIVKEIGGVAASSWLPISYTLAAAVPIPFCGYLQDIFGRRPIALGATAALIVGSIIMGTAHSFAQGVVGMTICGAGAGIAELSVLAG